MLKVVNGNMVHIPVLENDADYRFVGLPLDLFFRAEKHDGDEWVLPWMYHGWLQTHACYLRQAGLHTFFLELRGSPDIRTEDFSILGLTGGLI